MKAEKEIPETDKEPLAPHPRETFAYVGHDESETALSDGLRSGKMHHAWLLAGPKGLGKATLAYRFARVALGAQRLKGGRPFDVDPEDQIARRIAARAHPDLFILRRELNDRGRPRREIAVDDARELSNFFALSPSEGGMRVAIIDAVDDLNRNAANAILKTLEEPPARAVLMLVCHAPGGALATIRSRCRRLPFRPMEDAAVHKALGEGDEALIRLARGRPGRAIALRAQGAGKNAAEFEYALASLARGEARSALPKLYDQLTGEPFEKLAALMELAGEAARTQGVDSSLNGGGEAWAEAWSALEALRIEAEDLDMDPKHALQRAIGVLDRAAASRR